MDTTPRVLVGYATAAGSTAGIAERVAATLREQGCEVDCRPVGPDLELAGFDAFIVGSAVHDMAWLRPAVDVLGRLPTDGRPVWCFSVGGMQPSGAVRRRMTTLELRRVEEGFPAGFRARGHRFFGGIVVTTGLPLWGRLFLWAMCGRPGDHRDWPAVEGWAGEIAGALTGTSGGPDAEEGPETPGRRTSGTPRSSARTAG